MKGIWKVSNLKESTLIPAFCFMWGDEEHELPWEAFQVNVRMETDRNPLTSATNFHKSNKRGNSFTAKARQVNGKVFHLEQDLWCFPSRVNWWSDLALGNLICIPNDNILSGRTTGPGPKKKTRVLFVHCQYQKHLTDCTRLKAQAAGASRLYNSSKKVLQFRGISNKHEG